MINLEKQERIKAIKRLRILNQDFPESLMLFSFSGKLCVCDSKTMEIIEWFDNILTDGGEPRIVTREGKDYIGYD